MDQFAQSRPRNALTSIDLLRFAAATMVMVHHYFGRRVVSPSDAIGSSAPLSHSPWVTSGWVGVEIFFVISGYVIAMSASNVRAVDFGRRRALRLFPAAMICSTITAFTLLVTGYPMVSLGWKWFASFFLIPSTQQVDPVYWTLGIECAFYALVTGIIAMRRWNCVHVALGLAIWCCVYWTFAMLRGQPPSVVDRFADLSLGRYGVFFAIGMLIRACHERDSDFRAWHLACATVIVPIIISWHSGSLAMSSPIPSLTYFAIAMIPVIFAPQIQAKLSSPRLSSIAITLGLATYPLYLVHQMVGETIIALAALGGIPTAICVLPVMALMVVLSIIIARNAEPMVRRQLLSTFEQALPKSA